MNVLHSTSSGAARLADGALELTVVGGFGSPGIRVRRRMFGWSDPPRLDGRRVVITGATSGIGLACARAMIDLGAQVSIVGRDPDRTRATARDLGRRSASEVTTYIADLDLLGNARRVADEIDADGRPVDVLVHNAGALTAEYRRTEDGFEATYAAQVLSQHVLTSRLLPALQRSSSPRVIVVASGGMYAEKLDVATVQMTASDYDGVRAYARAKRAQVTLTQEWARRFPDCPVAFHSMHPGWADTPGVQASLPTFRRLTRPILRTPQEGADTIVWLAGVDPIPGANGSFWLDRAPRATVRSPGTRPAPGDPAALWDLVCQQTGEAPACPG
jgi:NAD(P)-dependent dehydrogenase (short-subunit alcohol dehydrogenase family)